MADDFGWSAAAEPAKDEFGWSQEQPQPEQQLPAGYSADQSPAALRQKGWGDLDLWSNTISNFSGGVERIKKAVEANRDPEQPWYQPIKTGWEMGAGGLGAVSAPVSAVMQAAGLLGEKASGGLLPSDSLQTAMMLAPFMPKAKLVAPAASTIATPIRPITYADGSPARAVPRSVAAQTGIAEVDALLSDPTIKATIDNAVPDRSHTIPYEAGGSLPLDNPATYVDKHVPDTFTVSRISDPSQKVTFDPAEPISIHENIEEPVMEMLIKGGMTNEEAYRVAHFGFAQPAEHAWYVFHDIDPAAAEAEWKKLQPGIQREIATDTPPDLYHKEYPGGSVTAARHEDVFETQPTPEEMARGMEIVRNSAKPVPDPAAAMKEARDLGAIGPEPKPVTEGTPAEAAARATQPPGGPPRPPGGGDGPGPGGQPANPARDKAGNIRLDQIGINADAKEVMLKAAETNDDFMAARRGEVPLAQVSALSEATGLPTAVLEQNQGLGRLMHNDAVVRTWLQAFHQATDELAAQMGKVKLGGTEKDLEDLRDMKLRFQHMQEQVSGLTAEAGRTLRVFRDFYDAKGKAEDVGKLLEDNPGNDAASLKKLAAAGAELDRAQLPKWLADQRKPNWWDWSMFYWINALISGPITHAKYITANGVFAAFEHGVTTPIASAIGQARRVVGLAGDDRVYLGESPAALWGIVQGTPDAIVAAAKAFRSGMKTPTPGDIAEAVAEAKAKGLPEPTPEAIAQSMSPFMGTKMLQGAHTTSAAGKAAVTAISVPIRSATGIHSFFNFVGYSARIQRDAYRNAIKEGLTPASDTFWSRMAYHADNPGQATMAQGITDGARMTFMRESGPATKAFKAFVDKVAIGKAKPLQLIFPIIKIPVDIMRATTEHTPLALATIAKTDSELGDALMGKSGAVAQDTAMARIAGGSTLMAFAVNWAMNDRVTGDGPRDPKERQLWLLSHQPNSIRIGDTWYSFDKFGPAGNLMRLGAGMAEVAPHLKPDSEEMTKAAALSVHAASKIVIDEVGMMGLSDLIEAANDQEHKGARFLSSLGSSFLPYSSAQAQIASWRDPEMRQVKSFIDGIKYRIPGERETLYPARDWSGQMVANPAHHDIIRQRPVGQDPVDLELQNLNYSPAPPTDRVAGVKLTPKLADEYKATAGALTRQSLEGLVAHPGWYSMPPYARQEIIKNMIKGARSTAAAAMQARYPAIIQTAVQNKVNKITGAPQATMTGP